MELDVELSFELPVLLKLNFHPLVLVLLLLLHQSVRCCSSSPSSSASRHVHHYCYSAVSFD